MLKLVACLTILTFPLSVVAQSSKAAKPYQVIVVRPKTTLESRKSTLGPLGLGEVLWISQERDGWLWVPAKYGWVSKEKTLPVAKAIDAFSAGIRKKPTATLFHHRGLAYAAGGKHKDAIDDFTEALRRDPRNTSVLNNRGNSWRITGSLKNALADYTAAITIDANNAAAFNNRGQVYTQQGKMADAMTDFNRALKIRPTFADALNNRGVVFRRQGKLKAALDDYNRALKWNPRHPAALANRGYAHKRGGEFGKAVADYKAALEFAPQLPTANNDLAWLLATCPQEQYRDGKLAVKHALIACELTRYRDWNMLETLAAANAENGEFDQAIVWIKQAARYAPKSQRAALNRHLQRFSEKKPLRSK